MNRFPNQFEAIRSFIADVVTPVIVECGFADGGTYDQLKQLCKVHPHYVALEPDPRWWVHMRKTRPTPHPKFRFFPYAAGKVTGLVDFWQATPDPACGQAFSSSISEFREHLKFFPHIQVEGKIRVNCMRLDDLVIERLGHNHVDLLWLDVQGAERLVFEGAQRLLQRTHYVFTEYDDGSYYADSSTKQDILNQLPGWEELHNTGNDVLLKNPSYATATL